VFQVRSDPADADPFGNRSRAGGFQRSATDVLIKTAARRVRQYATHSFATRLQVLRDARERTAGSARSDEGINPTVGLIPDLRALGLHVRFTVRCVVELIRPDGVGQR